MELLVVYVLHTLCLSLFLMYSSLIGATEDSNAICLLTFEDALQRTVAQSPVLKASLAEIEERAGERIQSELYFNPFFSYSVENVLGSHHWKGWESAESRYEIAQVIPINGQKRHRSKAALYRYYAAQAEYAAVQLHLFNELKKTYLEVAAGQELIKIATQQQQISEEVLQVVQDKVELGKVSPIEKNKAMLGLANSQLLLQKFSVDLEAAKQRLVLFWASSDCPDFDRVDYPLFQLSFPSWDECWIDQKNNPELIRIQFEQCASYEELEFEHSARIPDIVVSVGYKTVHGTGDRGMILGASFPLPLFDRNQGNIHRGRAETCRLNNQYIEAQLQLETKFLLLHKETMRAYQEALLIKENLLQLAQESYIFARSGYEEGKFEYLDLLDSQKTLFEAQERYMQALLHFLKKQVDIEYLTL